MAKKEKKTEETPVEETLQEEIKEETPEINPWEEKYNAEHDQYLRLYAEYDNFRKRTAKEREGIYADAFIDAIKGILPVIDNIERITGVSTDEKTLEGINLIIAGVKDTLSKMGVTEIETKAFDPNSHNAVMHIEDEAIDDNTVVEEFMKGYIYKDSRVVRHSMVKVAN